MVMAKLQYGWPMPSLKQSHVVFLVPHYATIAEGSSLRSVAVARALAEKCKKLTVITPDLSERVMSKRDSKPGSDGDIEILYMRGRENYRASFWVRILHELTLAKNCLQLIRRSKPDLVIASYPPAFTPIPALIYTRLHRRSKMVLEVRDLMAGALEASGYARNPMIVGAARFYERTLLRWSDAVAIVSPGMIPDICKVAPKAEIMPAYNGIEDTMLDFSDELPIDDTFVNQFRANTCLGVDENYVLYAGALTQSYDLPTLIKGFAKADLPRTKFIILGNGEKRDEYEKLAHQVAPGRVVFHDFVDRVSALKIIGQAEVALHAFDNSPHWGYVLGNKVFDYIVMGTPVLFAGKGTTAELVRDSGAGAVSMPGDVDELARVLTDLARGSEVYKQNPVGKAYVKKHWRRSDQTKMFVAALQHNFNS